MTDQSFEEMREKKQLHILSVKQIQRENVTWFIDIFSFISFFLGLELCEPEAVTVTTFENSLHLELHQCMKKLYVINDVIFYNLLHL